MVDQMLFIVFPYVALVLAFGFGFFRYYTDRFSFSSVSSQLLEPRALFWGSVPWHYAIVLILIAHLIGLVIAQPWTSLQGIPTALFIITLTGGALGFLALFGLLVLIFRRLFDAKARAVTTVMDWILLVDLLLQVAAGLAIMLFYRWGTMWYQFTAAPWIASLFSLSPKIEMITPLPWVVQFHFFNGFVVIGLFPFTRLIHIFTFPLSYLWRPYQIALWNNQSGGGPGEPHPQGGSLPGPGRISRRNFFMKTVIGVFISIGSLVLAIPFLRAIFRSEPITKTSWSEVTDLTKVPTGTPVNVDFETVSEQAYIHGQIVRSVWVIKHSADQVSVFSPICPHLGCYYKWNARAHEFQCPCHGSIFTTDGKVVGGPAPRPLDTLPFRIENDTLFVQWQEFRVGVPQKIRI